MSKKDIPPWDQTTILTILIEQLEKLNRKVETIVQSNIRLQKMQEELTEIIGNNGFSRREGAFEPTTMALLSLPASLRKTALALYKFDKATAEDLAAETKRLRSVESSSANQLVRMGYINKKQEGKRVYFYIGQLLGETQK